MAAGGMRVDLHEPAIRALLTSPTGPVAKELSTAAQKVTMTAKRLCPVSPAGSGGNRSGHLRSSISWDLVTSGAGLHADVGTDVWYALYVEFPTKPHVIRSHGNWPLRDAKGNVYGREVRHPGTAGQSFLRAALDSLRGG